jgi:hypothetical protein
MHDGRQREGGDRGESPTLVRTERLGQPRHATGLPGVHWLAVASLATVAVAFGLVLGERLLPLIATVVRVPREVRMWHGDKVETAFPP